MWNSRIDKTNLDWRKSGACCLSWGRESGMRRLWGAGEVDVSWLRLWLHGCENVSEFIVLYTYSVTVCKLYFNEVDWKEKAVWPPFSHRKNTWSSWALTLLRLPQPSNANRLWKQVHDIFQKQASQAFKHKSEMPLRTLPQPMGWRTVHCNNLTWKKIFKSCLERFWPGSSWFSYSIMNYVFENTMLLRSDYCRTDMFV